MSKTRFETFLRLWHRPEFFDEGSLLIVNDSFKKGITQYLVFSLYDYSWIMEFHQFGLKLTALQIQM